MKTYENNFHKLRGPRIKVIYLRTLISINLVSKLQEEHYQVIFSSDFCHLHCIKYRNITEFPGVEILWNRTIPAELRANRPKLCGNCAFL